MATDMKKRMAEMRAAKGKKNAKPPKVKAPAVETAAALYKREQKVGKAIVPPLPHADVLPAAPVIPAAVKRKSWKLRSIEDLCMLPDEQISYAMHYIKLELTRAIRSGKVIESFIWHEGQRLETFLIDDPFGG